jgi:hypothetical protein
MACPAPELPEAAKEDDLAPFGTLVLAVGF